MGLLQDIIGRMVGQNAEIAALKRAVAQLQRQDVQARQSSNFGAGGWFPGLASVEELSLVAVAVGGHPVNYWNGYKINLETDPEDPENPIIAVPDEEDTIWIYYNGYEQLFEGCVGWARFVGYTGSTEVKRAVYAMIASEAGGMSAHISDAPDEEDEDLYPWIQSYAFRGLENKSSDDYGLARCHGGWAYDPVITAPRMVYPVGTPIIVRWDWGKDEFYFSGTVDPSHGLCVEP